MGLFPLNIYLRVPEYPIGYRVTDYPDTAALLVRRANTAYLDGSLDVMVSSGILVTVKQRQEFRIRLQKRARRVAERKLESFVEERNARTVRDTPSLPSLVNYLRQGGYVIAIICWSVCLFVSNFVQKLPNGFA